MVDLFDIILYSRTKRINYLLFALILILIVPGVCASSEAFSSDPTSINLAAQSVLLLEVYNSNDEIISTGSGFLAFDNYTLITNEHVIGGAEYIIARNDTNREYMVTKVIAADNVKDIAILEFFSPTDLKPLPLAMDNQVARGEKIVAVGSPLGLKNTVSLGNVSGLIEENGQIFIQFTAPISPGSSGGALLNDKGEVIGITSAILLEGQNLNLAVSIYDAVALYRENEGADRVKLSDYLEEAFKKDDTKPVFAKLEMHQMSTKSVAPERS